MAVMTLTPAATAIDWEIIKGCDSFTIVVPVLDATNASVTVDGWSVKAQVRRTAGEPLLHEWSTADANASCSGTNVNLQVIASVTAAWTWTDAQMSIVVTDLVSKPHCIAAGRIRALPDITVVP
jgi:hypothetical protein